MRLLLGSVVLALSVLLFSPAVCADAVPPEEFACAGGVLKAGDKCTMGDVAGTCKQSQCSHTWRDGGVDVYACLECDESAPPSDSSCTIGKQSAVRRIGPWALAGLFSLLALFGRRWRRR
jgi:MYXO-CTERM domain-containing protein